MDSHSYLDLLFKQIHGAVDLVTYQVCGCSNMLSMKPVAIHRYLCNGDQDPSQCVKDCLDTMMESCENVIKSMSTHFVAVKVKAFLGH